MEPIVEQRGTYKFTWKQYIVQLIFYMPITMLVINLFMDVIHRKTEFDILEIRYYMILAVISMLVTWVMLFQLGKLEKSGDKKV